MKRKLTALLLCLVMALSLIPAMSYADNIVEGTNWYLDRNHCLHLTGTVTNNSTNSIGNTPWKTINHRSYRWWLKTAPPLSMEYVCSKTAPI